MRKEFDEEDELKKSTRGKKNNQKMKPFLVYQYLMRHTDENHVIRADDICLAMAETYGIDAERRGIYRDIDEINKAILAFEEGISIKEAAEWIEDDESLKNIIFDKHQKGFCMQQRHYDYTDIQLLVESIYASKYLSEPQAERLIKILCEFVSEFQEKKIRHNAILTDRVKTNNSGVLNNIEKIDTAMSMEDKHTPEKISFKYLKYSISNLNQQVERRHGSRYEVSPYALLINDDNYYLLAYNDYVKDFHGWGRLIKTREEEDYESNEERTGRHSSDAGIAYAGSGNSKGRRGSTSVRQKADHGDLYLPSPEKYGNDRCRRVDLHWKSGKGCRSLSGKIFKQQFSGQKRKGDQWDLCGK